MNIWLAFAPFLIFALICHFIGPAPALVAGAVASGLLVLRDAMAAGRSAKLLEIGTFILFAVLAAYALAFRPAWSIIIVRLIVDSGLLLIILVSLLVGRPFTIQYAREKVAPEHWSSPEFYQTNRAITLAWALAFVAIVVADLLLLTMPEAHRIGIWLTIIAIIAAIKFTDKRAEAGRDSPSPKA